MKDSRLFAPAYTRRSIGRSIRRGKMKRMKFKFLRFSRRPIKVIDTPEQTQPRRTYLIPPDEASLFLTFRFDGYGAICALCGGFHNTETIAIGCGLTAETCPNVIQPEPEYYDVPDFYSPPVEDLLELQRQTSLLTGATFLHFGQISEDTYCQRQGALDDYLRRKAAEFSSWRDGEDSEKMAGVVGDHVHNARGESGSCTRCRMRLNPHYE